MQKHTAVALAQTILIVVILLWFTSQMVDCESFLSRECDKAIWASWLDLWRLGWIKNYKELIAGALAAGAAGLIVVTTKMQIGASEQSATAQRMEKQAASLIDIAERFATASRALNVLSVTEDDCKMLDNIQIPDGFTVKDIRFFNEIRVCALNGKRALNNIYKLIAQKKKPANFLAVPKPIRIQALQMAAIAVAINRYVRHEMKGTGTLKPTPPGKIIRDFLKESGLTTQNLDDLARHFDLSMIQKDEANFDQAHTRKPKAPL